MAQIECDCGADGVAGALYMAPSGDASLPYVEACDDCRRFDTDVQAAQAVAQATGGLLVFGVDEDAPAGLELSHCRPAVLPSRWDCSLTRSREEAHAAREPQECQDGCGLDVVHDGDCLTRPGGRPVPVR